MDGWMDIMHVLTYLLMNGMDGWMNGHYAYALHTNKDTHSHAHAHASYCSLALPGAPWSAAEAVAFRSAATLGAAC